MQITIHEDSPNLTPPVVNPNPNPRPRVNIDQINERRIRIPFRYMPIGNFIATKARHERFNVSIIGKDFEVDGNDQSAINFLNNQLRDTKSEVFNKHFISEDLARQFDVNFKNDRSLSGNPDVKILSTAQGLRWTCTLVGTDPVYSRVKEIIDNLISPTPTPSPETLTPPTRAPSNPSPSPRVHSNPSPPNPTPPNPTPSPGVHVLTLSEKVHEVVCKTILQTYSTWANFQKEFGVTCKRQKLGKLCELTFTLLPNNLLRKVVNYFRDIIKEINTSYKSNEFLRTFIRQQIAKKRLKDIDIITEPNKITLVGINANTVTVDLSERSVGSVSRSLTSWKMVFTLFISFKQLS